MLDATSLTKMKEIASDRTSGAAELGLRAAELVASVRTDDLREAASAVASAQPAMASVYNAAQAALAGRLEDFVARLRRSQDIIADRVAHRVRGKVVLTHSYSSTIVHALQCGIPQRVICTESLPGGEGRRTAALLHGE